MDQFPYEYDLQRELRIKKIKENYDKVMAKQDFKHPYNSAESILKNFEDYDSTNKIRRQQRIQKSDYFKSSILDRVSYGLGGQGKTQQLIEEITQKQVEDIASGKLSSNDQKSKNNQNIQKIMSLKQDLEKANFPYLQKMYQPYDPFYNPIRGFIVHFDTLTPISAKVKQLKLSYSVFYQGGKIVNQENTFQPFEKEFLMEKHCEIKKREIFMRIKPDPRIVLYIELELYMKQYRQKPDIIAWSIVKLFDNKDKLISGKLQLPFYSQQSDTIKLLLEQPDPQMQILEDTKLNLRISVPFDPELDTNKDFDDVYKNNQEDYKIPALHQENIHQSMVDNNKLFNYNSELQLIRNQHLKPWDLNEIAEEDLQELQKRQFEVDPKDHFLNTYEETKTNNLYYQRYKINNDWQDQQEEEDLLRSLIGGNKNDKKQQNNKPNINLDQSFEKLLDDEELKEKKPEKKKKFIEQLAMQGFIYDDTKWVNIQIQEIQFFKFKQSNEIKYKLWFEKEGNTLLYTKHQQLLAATQGLLINNSLKKQILKTQHLDYFFITDQHLQKTKNLNKSQQIFLKLTIILPTGQEFTGQFNIFQKNQEDKNKNTVELQHDQLVNLDLYSQDSQQIQAQIHFFLQIPPFINNNYQNSKKLCIEIKEINQYTLQECLIFKISLISDKGELKQLDTNQGIFEWSKTVSNPPNSKKKKIDFPENSSQIVINTPLDKIKDYNPTNQLNIHILFEFFKTNSPNNSDSDISINNINKQELGWFVRPLFKNKKIELNKVKNAKDILFEYPVLRLYPFNYKLTQKSKIKFQYSVFEQ